MLTSWAWAWGTASVAVAASSLLQRKVTASEAWYPKSLLQSYAHNWMSAMAVQSAVDCAGAMSEPLLAGVIVQKHKTRITYKE